MGHNMTSHYLPWPGNLRKVAKRTAANFDICVQGAGTYPPTQRTPLQSPHRSSRRRWQQTSPHTPASLPPRSQSLMQRRLLPPLSALWQTAQPTARRMATRQVSTPSDIRHSAWEGGALMVSALGATLDKPAT